jgi:hypothetical protein
LTKKLISPILVLALVVAMAGATPGAIAAQDECPPVAVNATTPLGVFMANVFIMAATLLDKFVTKEWNADNQTCNVTGLTPEGASLLASLGDITVYCMKIAADLVRMLAGT